MNKRKVVFKISNSPAPPRALPAVSISLYCNGNRASALGYIHTLTFVCRTGKRGHPIMTITVVVYLVMAFKRC